MALNRTDKLLVLAALAAALLGVLVLSVKENRTIVVEAKPTAIPNTPTSGTVVGTLQAPRYTGRTANGTTWNLSAESAEQRGSTNTATQTSTAELILTTLTASLMKPNEPPLTLHSKSAIYTQNTLQLSLPNGVEAQGTLGGYRVMISAPQANAELASSTLSLRGGVSATLWPR